ncbi:MAG: hypothetical protein HOP36_14575 [Methyloglobulus sp.]|nr:hypothetical protein [Methyloglobulus sp.]
MSLTDDTNQFLACVPSRNYWRHLQVFLANLRLDRKGKSLYYTGFSYTLFFIVQPEFPLILDREK